MEERAGLGWAGCGGESAYLSSAEWKIELKPWKTNRDQQGGRNLPPRNFPPQIRRSAASRTRGR